MIESYLLNHPWLPASLWAVLYTSDYYLTIWGARLHRRQGVYRVEGSYELTPEYQEDIDKERLISTTFVMWLIAGAVILLATGYLPGSRYVYGMFVGWFLVVEIGVHMRHTNNIAYYRRLAGSDPGISGQITLTKAFSYRHSAQELAGLSLFTLMAFALTNSPILLGGGLSLAYQSAHHISLARRRAK